MKRSPVSSFGNTHSLEARPDPISEKRVSLSKFGGLGLEVSPLRELKQAGREFLGYLRKMSKPSEAALELAKLILCIHGEFNPCDCDPPLSLDDCFYCAAKRIDAFAAKTVAAALQPLLNDGVISAGRARELTNMTPDQQREHWRRTHRVSERAIHLEIQKNTDESAHVYVRVESLAGWVEVIREAYIGGPVSHIVESGYIADAIRARGDSDA